MSDERIERHDRDDGGLYTLLIDGHTAKLTYVKAGDGKIITDHTLVPKALGGQGVGKKLVQRVVEDARTEGMKIIPTCWFVKQQIDRHPDWQDVLA